VIARVLENAGLSTTSISLVREHTEKVLPPRALFVPFPFGMALGRPHEPELQHRVLRAALELLQEPSGPVLRDFPDDEAVGEEPGAPLQASGVETEAKPADVAMETTQMRRYHEQWVERTGRTSVGLSKIPPTRFRGVVRFLEAFVAGGEADMAERPREMPLHVFVRVCVDDLKAMYYEARMVMKPNETGADIARWFWGETALGGLIRQVKVKMEASDDPAMKGAGYGIAR
jgi:hypothetical protein